MGWPESNTLARLLDPLEEGRSDATTAVVRVDDRPRSDDVGLLESDLAVRDDRSGVLGHHPRIGGEIEVQPAPDLPDELGIEHRLEAVGALVGEEDLRDRLEVILDRCAKPVTRGQIHALERTRRPLRVPRS